MAALLTRETLSNPYVFSTLSLKKLSGYRTLCTRGAGSWASNNIVFAPPTGEKQNSRRRANMVRHQLVSTCFSHFHLWGLSWPPDNRQHLQPSSHALPASQGPLFDDPNRRDPNCTGKTKVPRYYPDVPNITPNGGAITGQVWNILGRDPQDSRA